MKIKIGTRGSKLALAQAQMVATSLGKSEHSTELIPIKTTGDLDTITPLDQFEQKGIFTSELDKALINKDIDIAVHSCKDLPGRLATDIEIVATLPRGTWRDCLVARNNLDFLKREGVALIATGSARRKAQWKKHFPQHQFTGVRGNIDTRLNKLYSGNWDGMILAKTALDRLGIIPNLIEVLDHLPSPGQGIIAVTALSECTEVLHAIRPLNHEPTFTEMLAERAFLQEMNVGCSFPMAALAQWNKDSLLFKAETYDINGKYFYFELLSASNEAIQAGITAAKELKNGMQW